jgi:hypothetical protein
MNTFRSILAVIAALAAVAIQSSRVSADPVGPTPAHTDVFSVAHIFANNKGVFEALVMCKSTSPVAASYRLLLQNGTGSFVKIKDGALTLAKNQSASIAANFTRTKAAQTLKLEVSSNSPKAFASRQVEVSSSKVYVLKYKTNGWVQVAYQFQKTTSELIGTAVKKPAADCRALGFKTRTRSEHTTVLFGTDSYRTYADARLDDFKEKTFDTKSERDKFERSLYKLVPSFTDAGTGLTTKKSEHELTTQK